MAIDFTEETAADAVVDSFANTQDPRLRELLSSLVKHLHAFVRETEPTIAEWERAIDCKYSVIPSGVTRHAGAAVLDTGPLAVQSWRDDRAGLPWFRR